jgi:hypothetical protein
MDSRSDYEDCERVKAAGQKSREVEFDFVDEAPAPFFAGLDGAHDGMLGVMKVLGGVLADRRVAAAYMSADEAEAEVYPPLADLEALFTAVGVWFDVADFIEVSTLGCHTDRMLQHSGRGRGGTLATQL